MANLRFRLTIISIGLVLVALALGWFAPTLMAMMPEQTTSVHLLAAAFVFVGLCGVAFYTLMERALNPVMRLIDTFTRMRAGDLNPRLPVEGPEEMRRMARGFNDMVEELETQIRDIEVEKQSAERARQTAEEQLSASERFHWGIDAAPVGVVITDANLQVVYQNPASESGFLQLDAFDANVVGSPVTALFPDRDEADEALSDPDRLPYEADVTVGPHLLHFIASPLFDEDEEYAGVILLWEESDRVTPATEEIEEPSFPAEFVESLEEEDAFDFNENLETVDPDSGIDEDVLAEVDELEADVDAFEMVDEDFEMVDEDEVLVDEAFVEEGFGETEPEPGNNGMPVQPAPAAGEVRRSAKLVRRSVGLLAERLAGVATSVDALCDEGDSFRRTIEDIRNRAERADQLEEERAEPVHDLLDETTRVAARREQTASLARSLKRGLADAAELGQAVDRLRGSIEHLVVSSKVELGRMGEETGGVRVVIDAIGDLGEEARRLGESTNARLRELGEQMDEVIELVRSESDAEGHEQRLRARAAKALARLEEREDETSQRNDLLAEMARGQAEIARHIAKQIGELSELVTLTSKVAAEQVEIVEGSTSVD